MTPVPNKREGTDFKYNWIVELEDTSLLLENIPIKLYLKHIFSTKEIIDYSLVGNTITIEFAGLKVGSYSLELRYALPDDTFSDGDRKGVIDIPAFNIVNESAQESEAVEFFMTSELPLIIAPKISFYIENGKLYSQITT